MFKFAADSNFLRRFKDGERAALEAVYLAYVDEVEVMVRRSFSSLIADRPSSARADPGDFVQEVFTRAFADKARFAYDGLRDFGPFLGSITRNLLVDWTRRRHRLREVSAVDLDQLPGESLAEMDDDWADANTMVAVEQYVAGLDLDLRRTHECRYVQCLTQEQASTALGISRQQLRTREKRLREGLEQHLKRLHLYEGRELVARLPASTKARESS